MHRRRVFCFLRRTLPQVSGTRSQYQDRARHLFCYTQASEFKLMHPARALELVTYTRGRGYGGMPGGAAQPLAASESTSRARGASHRSLRAAISSADAPLPCSDAPLGVPVAFGLPLMFGPSIAAEPRSDALRDSRAGSGGQGDASVEDADGTTRFDLEYHHSLGSTSIHQGPSRVVKRSARCQRRVEARRCARRRPRGVSGELGTFDE